MRNSKATTTLSAPVLAKLFSPSLITQVTKSSKSRLLASIVKESGFLDTGEVTDTLGQLFDTAFSQMETSYRNEYIYKNAIANKILLGRHSLNTAAMHTEFRVGDSKADVLILNGTSHIYEIKTELDSLDRLNKQIENYMKFAECVTIVGSKGHIDKLCEVLPSTTGIIELTTKGSLKSIRKAVSNRENLDNSIIFDSLQLSEYTEIIKKITSSIPNVSNALMFSECKKIFETLDVNRVYELVVKSLKLRNMDVKTKEFIMAVPVCLKAAVIGTKMTKTQRLVLLNSLNQTVSECMYNS